MIGYVEELYMVNVMTLGEYIDSLEDRVAALKRRWGDTSSYQALFAAASISLPAARLSIANLYVGLDRLDKALKPFERE